MEEETNDYTLGTTPKDDDMTWDDNIVPGIGHKLHRNKRKSKKEKKENHQSRAHTGTNGLWWNPWISLWYDNRRSREYPQWL